MSKQVWFCFISTTQDDKRINLVLEVFSSKSFYSALIVYLLSFKTCSMLKISSVMLLFSLYMRPIFTLRMSKADARAMQHFRFKNILTSQNAHKPFSWMIFIQILKYCLQNQKFYILVVTPKFSKSWDSIISMLQNVQYIKTTKRKFSHRDAIFLRITEKPVALFY